MSMHKAPLTPTEEAGFHAHGLQRNIGKPSQLADVFRQGVAWGIAAERERCAEIVDVPADIDAWEVIGGQETMNLLRELAAKIRGPNE